MNNLTSSKRLLNKKTAALLAVIIIVLTAILLFSPFSLFWKASNNDKPKNNEASFNPSLLLISGNSSQVVNGSDILSMPSYTGVGTPTRNGGDILYDEVGNYTGVPLLYLCNLVGGIDSSSLVTVYASDGYQTTFTYSQVNNNIYPQFNITTGASITGQNPMTILAYACNGTYLTNGSNGTPDMGGPLRIMIVSNNGTSTILDNDGMTTYGDQMVKYVTEIEIYYPPTDPLAFKTCDALGNPENGFNQGANVYFSASGLNSSAIYAVYVVPYAKSWIVGTSIPIRVYGTATSITTDTSGDIVPTCIFGDAQASKYDVVVKANSDGTFDEGDLLLPAVVSTPIQSSHSISIGSKDKTSASILTRGLKQTENLPISGDARNAVGFFRSLAVFIFPKECGLEETI